MSTPQASADADDFEKVTEGRLAAPRTGVANEVIGWSDRARRQQPAQVADTIGGKAHVITRFPAPATFVEQSGRVAVEHG